MYLTTSTGDPLKDIELSQDHYLILLEKANDRIGTKNANKHLTSSKTYLFQHLSCLIMTISVTDSVDTPSLYGRQGIADYYCSKVAPWQER